MIAFIVPFRPKSESKNWGNDCALLQQTVRSLLNQAGDNFKVFVVYTDKPELQSDDRVEPVHFPYDFAGIESVPGHEKIMHQFNNDKKMFERRWDKGRKITYGSMIAKQKGFRYIMSVDADDLVSGKLATYITKRITESDVHGFYIDKGYLYRNGDSAMILVPEKMHLFNGSTHIIREDFVAIPDFETGSWTDFSLFTSHGWIKNRLKEKYGCILEPINFPAVIYIAHSGNISKVNQLNFKDKVKRFIKMLIRRKSITREVREEFCLSV